MLIVALVEKGKDFTELFGPIFMIINWGAGLWRTSYDEYYTSQWEKISDKI